MFLNYLTIFLLALSVTGTAAQFEQDTIATNKGDLVITFIGHATLMFNFNGLVIHVDPVSGMADYQTFPKADIILVTHHHGDHFDPKAIALLKKAGTDVILTKTCSDQGESGIVMENGDEKTIKGLRIKAVPAYNLVHKRDNGEFFHPKGIGNGYVINFGDKSVYIAGDTENIPEMKDIASVDIAFLPMNLPYTMTPEMVADAVKKLKPKILYPYHYGDTDTNILLKLLKSDKDVEVRVRKMK